MEIASLATALTNTFAKLVLTGSWAPTALTPAPRASTDRSVTFLVGCLWHRSSLPDDYISYLRLKLCGWIMYWPQQVLCVRGGLEGLELPE
jgi:hypothetical protein